MILAIQVRHFPNQLTVSFVEGLEPEPPTVQLNVELINVTVNLSALRFILLQMTSQLRQLFDRG